MSKVLFVVLFGALAGLLALALAAAGSDSVVVPAPGPKAPPTPPPAKGISPLPAGDSGPQAPVRVDAAPADPAPPQVLLVSPDRDRQYRAYWPKGEALEPLHKRDLVFYDSQAVPRAYQIFDAGSASGVYLTANVAATANGEFPWARPAGTVEGAGVTSVRFVAFGGPVRWWRQAGGGVFRGFAWEFAEGTTFGEVLVQTDPRGFGHAWEVRTRTKKADGGWGVQVYRPFVTEDDYAAALRERGLVYAPPPARRLSVDSGHQRDAFRATGWAVTLPPLDAATVADLLDSTPFEPALGKSWRVERGHAVEAPTSDADFGVVPRGFLGWALPVDNGSCMRCHADAGRTVNLPGEARWRLRGGDGIFSWNIFDPDSLKTTTVKLNVKLREAGLVEHDPGRP